MCEIQYGDGSTSSAENATAYGTEKALRRVKMRAKRVQKRRKPELGSNEPLLDWTMFVKNMNATELRRRASELERE